LSAPKFDYQVVNDDFEKAYREFQNILENSMKN
jgi:guanylate kinase